MLLARNDININERTPDSKHRPGLEALSNAASSGHKEIVEVVLARKDIDVHAGEIWEFWQDQSI